MRLSSSTRLLAALLAALVLTLGGGAAQAATSPVDDSAYSETQKAAAEKAAAVETAERTCDLVAIGPLQRLNDECVAMLQSSFTRETVPLLAGAAACNVLTGVVLPLKTACLAVVATQAETIQGWFWDAYGTALTGAEVVASMAKFVTDPEHGFEAFANYMKEDAVGLFTAVMTYVTGLSSADVGAQWWRDAYAATAGIGLALMAIMLLLTAQQFATGEVGPNEAVRSARHFVTGAFMLVMGPPVAWAVVWVSDGLSAGIVSWMGPDSVEFLTKATLFSGFTVKMTGGLIVGFVLFGLLALTALGVWGTFLVQTISVYVLGVVGAIAWGMTGNPRWRSKALRLPLVWVGLVLAKPAMLLVLGVVVKFSNSVDLTPQDADEGLRTLSTALMVCLAMLFVAFAPWTLLKWFPLLPDGSESTRSSGPVMFGAAVGAAGSTATTMAMMRARGDSSRRSSAPARTTDAPRQQPQSTSAPAARPAPAVTANPTAAAGAKGPGLGSVGGAGTARAGAGGAARATGGAAPVAGGAAKAAGSAAGGAATGGALLAAQLAAAAAQAAVQKARESAAAAAPDIHGGGQ